METTPILLKAPIKTDTFVAHYAKIPTANTYMEYLVKRIQPLETIPYIIKFPYSGSGISILTEKVLTQWKLDIKNSPIPIPPEYQWLLDIDQVKMIECDLLVPIVPKQRKTK